MKNHPSITVARIKKQMEEGNFNESPDGFNVGMTKNYMNIYRDADPAKFYNYVINTYQSKQSSIKYLTPDDINKYIIKINTNIFHPKSERSRDVIDQDSLRDCKYMNTKYKLIRLDPISSNISYCNNCARDQFAAQLTKLLTCGRCHCAKYCSKKCQIEDWPQHSQFCRQKYNLVVEEWGRIERINHKYEFGWYVIDD
jgi:hypothetical protein